jgi:tetratricopeptide (TPR) repeat protein
MSRKRLGRSALTYFKNLIQHTKRVFMGRESVGQALRGVGQDSGRLREAVAATRETEDQYRARRLVEKARHRYNDKRFDHAERFLREALTLDRSNPWASLYLGNVLYKEGRFREAIVYWEQTISAAADSEAATKARLKLQRVESEKRKINDWYEERLGKS